MNNLDKIINNWEENYIKGLEKKLRLSQLLLWSAIEANGGSIIISDDIRMRAEYSPVISRIEVPENKCIKLVSSPNRGKDE